MKNRGQSEKFKGYARDKFEMFRKQKEEQFHRRFGRFADKTANLTNSRVSTMAEPGSMLSMDSLYEDSGEKLFALASISRCLFIQLRM